MDYIKRAIELSQESADSGGFPAGAVLVSGSGKFYESGKSVGYYHGEMAVIDKAIEAEGAPLNGAVLYCSMEPCLMCAAKMYWSGVERAEYVIPKSKVDAIFAYENPGSVSEQIKDFFVRVELIEKPEHLEVALPIYDEWYRARKK